MATKENPGAWDCYANAADDEPLFVLLARDPAAPCLVQAWRYLRAGLLEEAKIALENGQGALNNSRKQVLPLDSEKSQEAMRCAIEMSVWNTDHKP